ncbi:Methyl-accepting chemotaxis protein I (serine chemoreceptor protein) [Caballeronia sordidicola]|uniref:Methyl-accepting chemotaxis protein I (Serine chemoreceptor protein) n=1 Tax=Caballeronia sordidicola TaxID=196367 RepID=A0A242M9A1_CABSO|nr:Methyl-accepting chemotaxis protein I (serine chemoreceptor protein) [Caballeronia sordidicola]
MTLNRKLASVIAMLWLGLIAIGILGAWQNRTSMVNDRRDQLSTLIDEAYTTTEHYADLVENKMMSENEAKRLALDSLRAARYGTDGYISVSDSHAIILMHPFKPAMVGKDMSSFVDSGGNKLFLDIAKAGNKPAGEQVISRPADS